MVPASEMGCSIKTISVIKPILANSESVCFKIGGHSYPDQSKGNAPVYNSNISLNPSANIFIPESNNYLRYRSSLNPLVSEFMLNPHAKVST